MGREKTWITEANLGTVAVLVAWIGLQFGVDMPGDVAVAIGGIVVAGVNIGMRILYKKGLI
jgi:hypothetical protein